MKAWASLLLLLLSFPAASQQVLRRPAPGVKPLPVPEEISKIYSSLLPLHESVGGACKARADVWQQQLQPLVPADRQATVVLYFAEAGARFNPAWTFHVAPAILVGEEVWVLEKGPYLNEPLPVTEWAYRHLKDDDRRPCEMWPRFLAREAYDPFRRCLVTFTEPGETDGRLLLAKEQARIRDSAGEAARSYSRFIAHCAEVILPDLDQGARTRAQAKCAEKFPESEFHRDLYFSQ